MGEVKDSGGSGVERKELVRIEGWRVGGPGTGEGEGWRGVRGGEVVRVVGTVARVMMELKIERWYDGGCRVLRVLHSNSTRSTVTKRRSVFGIDIFL